MTARELAISLSECIGSDRGNGPEGDILAAQAMIEAHDAEVRAEGGDGTPEKPFRATYNPKCFQRHDAELYVKICERDDGFEITAIPPRVGPTRHYRIDATGSWADLARPEEDKTVPWAMLSDVWSCDMKDAAGMKREVLGIAARYGYKVEEGTP